MADIKIKDAKGKEVGKHSLKKEIGGVEVSQSLLHSVVVAEESNARQGTHSVRTRAEAQGGGRKPYRQKKTGRARHGSIRSPIWTHGGMAHAIKPRDYSKKVNKLERRKAMLGAFVMRANDGDIILVDKLSFDQPKTKDAAAMLEAWGCSSLKRVLLVLPEADANVVKSFRNIGNVVIRSIPKKNGRSGAFSTRDLLVAHKIVMSKDAMEQLEQEWTS